MRIEGRKYIKVGRYCTILNNARIQAITYWGNQALNPVVEIGDNVLINQNFHCTCGGHISVGGVLP